MFLSYKHGLALQMTLLPDLGQEAVSKSTVRSPGQFVVPDLLVQLFDLLMIGTLRV